MVLEETYRVERTKWDALATERSAVSILPQGATFHSYAERDPELIGVAEFLGDLRGKRVLEYGCGLGRFSTLLAKSGAQVTAFDLSQASTVTARRRAVLNGVNADVNLTVAAGESLPYADESFDVIFGKAILHHLDVHLGWPDLYRVLKPGGKAVFSEPMGMNPILNVVRDRVPYPNKNPRGADRPVNYDEIRDWGKGFSQFRYREIQLVSMLQRGFGLGKRFPVLRRVDDLLLEHVPFLRRYCRYVVMFMVK